MKRLRAELPSLALALAAGAATVFAFAPFGLAGLPMVTLALLFALWQPATARTAARIGFAFGAGLFGVGVSWVYIALNSFGEMPAPLAAIGTALFCAYSALWPALTGAVATRITPPDSASRALASAAAWTLCEWARSWVLTGFPWLAMGYAQIPLAGPTPLAGFAPLGGVFLVSLTVCCIAAALAWIVDALAHGRYRALAACIAGIVILVAAGALLQRIEWTRPVGAPIAVSLVQGNITQDVKFDPAFRDATYDAYIDLVRRSPGRLVVLPESALPAFLDEVPDSVLQELASIATARDGSVLTGVFTIEPPLPGKDMPRYYNSVVSLDAGTAQLYRKRHLVPFGETIPLEPIVGWFIRSVLEIPLADQSAGADDQPPLRVAGQAVAVDICYEDVFGADIRPQAAAATLLVNVTNDAWYGRSLAALQHNQIAAMRALETGRPLLRATNTGITSAIAHDGREIARLPWFTRATLDVVVTGREGITPFVRFGDAPAALVALALLAGAWLLGRRQRAVPG